MSNTRNLSFDFPSISSTEWLNKIEQDLKGKPYENLVWNTFEGFTIKPNHHQQDVPSTSYNVNWNNTNDNSFLIAHEVVVKNEAQANTDALLALKNGVNSLHFIVSETVNLSVLLNNVMIEIIDLNFTTQTPIALAKQLKTYAKTHSISFNDLNGSICYRTNTTTKNLNLLVHELKESNLACISINSSQLHYAGATCTQQIAVCLAQLNEIIGELNHEFTIDELTKKLIFKTTIGYDYFMEMSKLRSLKYTVQAILNEYGASKSSCKLVATASTLFWTDEDEENNLIRGSISAMAASIGGANTIYIPTFTSANNKDGTRLSTNILHILTEESNLNKVIDPANGSYYIESLSKQLSENSWELFKKIEAEGSYNTVCKNDKLHGWILEKTKQLIEAYNNNKLSFIGVNTYNKSNYSLTLGESNVNLPNLKLVKR